ncbi:hypothetical protein ACFY64_31425 [Streptomyces collinus]|uniref:hypothetical protein n=1 Tax=Streptomyces collinus TaxID=42684 RepID=UPI0036B22793
MKDIVSSFLLVGMAVCFVALVVAACSLQGREQHATRRRTTLPEQADRWTGGAS